MAQRSAQFCWIELATTDLVRAQRYYDRLLDWRTRSMHLSTPAGGSIHYHAIWSGERVVGGLYEHIAGPRALAAGAHWKAYVGVPDADAALRRAEELGARTRVPVIELAGYGRFAICSDPQGALLGLWQSTADGVMHSSRGELGCLRWMELASPGPAAAARFYGELFGWSAHAVELGGTTYRVLEQDDVQVGGIAGPDAPHARLGAQWLPYFRVADCAETSRHAQRLLGTPVTPPTWFSSDVRASVMRDAQGALLGWVEMR